MPGVFLYRVSGESVVGPEQIPSTSSVSQTAVQEETDDAENEDEEEADYYENVDQDYNQYETPTESGHEVVGNQPKIAEPVDRKMDAPDISDTAENQNNVEASTITVPATEAPAEAPTEAVAVAEPEVQPEPESEPEPAVEPVAVPTTVAPC